jgi:flagellin-like hook-associated protein FlgL
MSDIVLSSSIRGNLLSLQGTAELQSRTQYRLATGKKVNNALDNPTNFFTAAGLNSRAADVSRLLDGVSNATRTLEAADNGIKAITKLIENLQATARQALQSGIPADTAPTQTGTLAIANDVAPVLTGTVDLSGALNAAPISITPGQTLTVTINGSSRTIEFNNTGTASAPGNFAIDLDGPNDALDTTDDATGADLVARINTAFGGNFAQLNPSGQLVINGPNATSDISISATSAGVLSGLGIATVGTGTATARTVEPSNATLGGLSGTLTVQVGANATQTITFGTNDAAGEVNTRAELAARLQALTPPPTGAAISISSSGMLTITGGNNTDNLIIGGTGGVPAALGITAGSTPPTEGVNEVRLNLVPQFNNLREQIIAIARDASFNGVNLLTGDNLRVIFNEEATSQLQINGVNFDDLGVTGIRIDALTTTAFDDNVSVEATLTQLTEAMASLRSQASNFGSNLSVVQTRQEFLKSMINTLRIGADALTLADTNEEGANMLALQTRQQLSSTALSLATQAEQSVLRLFG